MLGEFIGREITDQPVVLHLAAGAIKSPQLLLLSGIGPADELQALGLPPRLDLPGVGQGLQDHLQVKLIYKVTGVTTLNQVYNSWPRRAGEALKYALFGKGALASGPSMCGGFARSDPALDLPDLQFHFNPLSGDRPGHLHDFPACTPIVSQLRPESRGRLWLKSTDPREQPAMLANYLDAESDRRTVVAGMRLTRKIMDQPAMQRLNARAHLPGPDIRSYVELLDAARTIGITQFHPISTCRMGVDAEAEDQNRRDQQGDPQGPWVEGESVHAGAQGIRIEVVGQG